MKRVVVMAMLIVAVALPTANAQSVKEHSATRALYLSLLPGGGQIYNRQAWKIPIIYGAFAGVGYFVYDNYQSMKMFRDEYIYRINNDGATNLSGYENYSTSNIYSLYNSYNQTFQLTVIIAVGVYALNLIDAYVFGHLFDFQVSNDLAFVPMVAATPQGIKPMLSLTINL